MSRALIVLVSALALALGSCGQPVDQPSRIEVSGAWTRETAAGQSIGGGFLTISNKGAAGDRLLGASSPLAARVEIHEMTMTDGIMRMRPIPNGIDIPAGKIVSLNPGGVHLMLIDLKEPLMVAESIPLTLDLERAGHIETALRVRPIGASGPND